MTSRIPTLVMGYVQFEPATRSTPLQSPRLFPPICIHDRGSIICRENSAWPHDIPRRSVVVYVVSLRSDIDALSGYKQYIALFALGKTCMSGKGGFGHFSSSTDYGKRQDTPDEFRERFAKNVARINALVFDSGNPADRGDRRREAPARGVCSDRRHADCHRRGDCSRHAGHPRAGWTADRDAGLSERIVSIFFVETPRRSPTYPLLAQMYTFGDAHGLHIRSLT